MNKTDTSLTGMGYVRKSIGMQIKCPVCRKPFTPTRYEDHIGCNFCGIYVPLGYPWILGNVVKTNQGYLDVVRACKSFIKEKEDEHNKEG